MTAVRIGDALELVGEMPWRQTVQASINEHSHDLERTDREVAFESEERDAADVMRRCLR